MAAVYVIYLYFFPLYPHINHPEDVSDIEMLLRDSRKWFAPFYVLGLGLLFLAYWRIMKIVHALSREEPRAADSLRPWVLVLGILFATLLIGLYPITALDVILYVVRARLWALYGGNPMLALPQDFPQDPYIQLAGEYIDQPSPYGPFWELIAQLPLQLGISSIGSGVIAMKLLALIAYIGMTVMIGWRSHEDFSSYGVSRLTAMTFFTLNPLVLMQAIGNGHNDMVMLALMTLGLLLWQRGKWIEAAFVLTLGSLIKITALILLPLFGMALLATAPDWRTRLRRALTVAIIFIVTSLVAHRLIGPFPDVFEGTRHAMLGRLGFSPSYAVRILFRYWFPGNRELIILPTNLGNSLFILYYLYLLLRLAQRKITLIEAGFMAYFSLLLLGSTFRIWYPLWLIPFAALNLNSSTYWRTFLFCVTAELSILMYYILWRWHIRDWEWGLNGPLAPYWDYWLIMTWLTVPWTFGIPVLGPWLRRRRNRKRFDETLWL